MTKFRFVFLLPVAFTCSCSLPEKDPIDYEAFCPTRPVALTWDKEDGDWAFYESTIAFEDCAAPLVQDVYVYGTRIPALYPSVSVGYENTEGGGSILPPTTSGSESSDVESERWWSRVDMTEGVSDSLFPFATEIGSGTYRVALFGHDRGDADYGSLTIDFDYDCNCTCSYRPQQAASYDYDGLNLRFGDPRIRTEPEKPLHLTPFDVVWTTCYDVWECMDPRAESGVMEVAYRIEHGDGTPLVSGTKEVDSVYMGSCIEHRLYMDGIAVEAPEEDFVVHLELNPNRRTCECIPSSGWPDPAMSQYEDNSDAFQFLVEWCDCTGQGDLVLNRHTNAEGVGEGEAYEISWTTCFESICGSREFESGEFTDSVVLYQSDGTLVADLSTEERTPSLGRLDCHRRTVQTPDDLAPGNYLLRIELDVAREANECPKASRENQIMEVEFRVVPEVPVPDWPE